MTLNNIINEEYESLKRQLTCLIAAAPNACLAIHSRLDGNDLCFIGNIAAATGMGYLVQSIFLKKPTYNAFITMAAGSAACAISQMQSEQVIFYSYLLQAIPAACLAGIYMLCDYLSDDIDALERGEQ